jgi:hypothetical protein
MAAGEYRAADDSVWRDLDAIRLIRPIRVQKYFY